MERVMSVEERIRRAEDIYNRRNGGYTKISPKNNENRKIIKKSSVKKLFMQTFICLLVYVVFYAVSNREHIFSEEFRNEIGSFLTEKTKISELYNNSKNYIKSKISGNETKEKNDGDVNNDSEEIKNDNQTPSEDINKEETKKDNKENENIGGASSEKELLEKKSQKQKDEKENISEQELMEKDAKEIKSKISFITPVKGRISSTFGWRNPTIATVPKYHTGLDIAAVEGTKIKSATDGKVIMASSDGDYGNHYQIQVQDVIIIYAHCKKLYLKEGATVKQGQEIAEVGNTGNSTGPHLHFEIRKNGRKIDPQLIIKI